MTKFLINARDVSVILGISPYMTKETLLFEKFGYKKKFSLTPDIYRGIKNEPIAIKEYGKKHKIKMIKCGFKRHDTYKYIGGTVDSIYYNLNNEKVIVEIKCPKNFNKSVPKHCYSQIQTYLQIHNQNNAKYVEYVQNKGLNEINVKKNDRWWEMVLKRIKTFYEELLYWDIIGIINHPSYIKFNFINYKDKYIIYNMPKGIDYSKFDKLSLSDDEQDLKDLKNLKCTIGKPLTKEEFLKETGGKGVKVQNINTNFSYSNENKE